VLRSCRGPVKLLGERQLLIAGIFRLLFAHHMYQFNLIQNDASSVNRPEAAHRPYAPLDGPMVMLNAIVQIGAPSDPDRRQFRSHLMLKPVCRITGQDGFPVALAVVDHSPLRSAVPLQDLEQKPFGGCQITPLAEPELDGITAAARA